jgi:hypothetical protein
LVRGIVVLKAGQGEEQEEGDDMGKLESLRRANQGSRARQEKADGRGGAQPTKPGIQQKPVVVAQGQGAQVKAQAQEHQSLCEPKMGLESCDCFLGTTHTGFRDFDMFASTALSGLSRRSRAGRFPMIG